MEHVVMAMPYGWFAAIDLGEDGVLELVRSVPNDGLTERIGGVWSDVYVGKDGKVVVEPADVGPVVEELERGRGGDLPYRVASALEVGKCICLETPKSGKKLVAQTTFRGWRCLDLAALHGAAAGLLHGGSDDGAHGEVLEALLATLGRALELHIAVVFGA